MQNLTEILENDKKRFFDQKLSKLNVTSLFLFRNFSIFSIIRRTDVTYRGTLFVPYRETFFVPYNRPLCFLTMDPTGEVLTCIADCVRLISVLVVSRSFFSSEIVFWAALCRETSTASAALPRVRSRDWYIFPIQIVG